MNTTFIIFLFTSPLFFVNHPDFCVATVEAAKSSLLRLVVMEKVHLHVQHGSSSRDDIRNLKDVFFRPVSSPKVAGVPSNYIHPRLLIATGTMANDYISLYLLLTTIGISHRNILWSLPNQFAQRNIHMIFFLSKKHVQLLDKVVGFIKKKPNGYCCVFVAPKKESFHLAKDLERKLNNKLVSVDVFHVHGSSS